METLVIQFSSECHGFKLSVSYKNRLYYYPNEYFDMDMKEIPPKDWTVVSAVKSTGIKTVTLISKK